ncbi:hypothetical protein G6F57_021438 [Rhizopus arrhizus]|nr:hypothetical protein G6F57_021438 [Rhizopus arrhizus]
MPATWPEPMPSWTDGRHQTAALNRYPRTQKYENAQRDGNTYALVSCMPVRINPAGHGERPDARRFCYVHILRGMHTTQLSNN